MGIDKLIGGKRRIRDVCETNPETGETTCVRHRINPNGTSEEIAGFTMSVEGNCNPVATNVFENEEGHLAKLEGKFVHKIVGKCVKNTPEDF